MERYWCLRWLAQESVSRVEAVVIRDDLVRLAPVPFVLRLADLPALAPGRRILIDILERDELELALSARFVELIEGTDEAAAGQEAWLAEETATEAAEGSDEQAESLAAGADEARAPDGVGVGSGEQPDHRAAQPSDDPAMVAMASPPPPGGS